MKSKDATKIRLDNIDIDYISRVVQTEIDPTWKGEVLENGVAAVVDTILNRVAYEAFPETVTGVVNERNAFTKINGPVSYYNSRKQKWIDLHPYGSVQNAPRASALVDRLVRETIADRAAGEDSIVGPSLHYANPDPAYSGKHAKGPDGWVWQIAQDPYLTTGYGNKHSHVHGTDPRMRPLKRAPEIGFVPSSEIDKAPIDDLYHIFTAPNGLDLVAPPIPASKGRAAHVNPMRADLIDRIERKPLTFKEFLDRTEAKLELQNRLAAPRENYMATSDLNTAGTKDLDIYKVGLLDAAPWRKEAEQKVETRQPPVAKRKPLPSMISGSSAEKTGNEKGKVEVPLPRPKPEGRASAAPNTQFGTNPFDARKPNLNQQAALLERNPVRAKQLILAAGRDPEMFGLSTIFA